MKDLIERQEAIDALDCISGVEEVLRSLPSAQPKSYREGYQAGYKDAQSEIIRCRECKYWVPYDWMFSEVWKSKNMEDYPENEIGCTYADMSMSAMDFCSRAERREAKP